jgi:hypothetical protein
MQLLRHSLKRHSREQVGASADHIASLFGAPSLQAHEQNDNRIVTSMR